MGTALEALLGLDVFTAACIVACISAVYVTWGGQTSVIVTDLFQGFMLILAGGLIFYFGIEALGGFGDFWGTLKPEHRMAFLTSTPILHSQWLGSSGRTPSPTLRSSTF